jgi:hypothetical protein
MFLGSAIIECGFEFGWSGNNNQTRISNETIIKEAILSSGASATYATLISIFLRIMRKKYEIKNVENDINQNDTDNYFYTSTLISQLLCGAISFGAGISFDYAFYKVLDNLGASSNFGLAFALPTVIVSSQVLARYGIFKVVDCIKDRFQYGEEIELQSTFNENMKLMNGVGSL